jgi:hypothetical protein
VTSRAPSTREASPPASCPAPPRYGDRWRWPAQAAARACPPPPRRRRSRLAAGRTGARMRRSAGEARRGGCQAPPTGARRPPGRGPASAPVSGWESPRDSASWPGCASATRAVRGVARDRSAGPSVPAAPPSATAACGRAPALRGTGTMVAWAPAADPAVAGARPARRAASASSSRRPSCRPIAPAGAHADPPTGDPRGRPPEPRTNAGRSAPS